MALQGQTVDIPIAPLNQQATTTSSVIGRLKRLVDGQAKKINRASVAGVPNALRIEKRDGWGVLPKAVRDPVTGAVKAAITDPRVLATYAQQQLVAVAGAITGGAGAPYVLSESAAFWLSPDYTLPPETLRQKPVTVNIGGTAAGVDSARIGSVTLYLWMIINAAGTEEAWVEILDDDGTAIALPRLVMTGPFGSQAKCISDGTRFWVIKKDATTLQFFGLAIAADGTTLGQTGFAAGAVAPKPWWDVTFNPLYPDTVFVAVPNATNSANILTLLWNGSAVTGGVQTVAGLLCSTGRLAFLTGYNAPNLVLATVDGTAPSIQYLGWLVSVSVSTGTAAVAAQFTPANGQSLLPVEMAGFFDSGSSLLTVAYSFLDGTPRPQLNYTEIRTCPVSGLGTLQRRQRSLTLASRAFRMKALTDPSLPFYAVGYYRSDPAGVTKIAQSTFFLLTLRAPYLVAGRFDPGTAYGDWVQASMSSYHLALSSPVRSADQGVHVALPFRAQSNVALQTIDDFLEQEGGAPVTSHTEPVLVDVLGIEDVGFGPDAGQAVESGTTLLLPGPEAVSYTGSVFTEDGLGLIPEVVTCVASGAGPLTGTYQYLAVDEWTDNAGQRVRSAVGVPFNVTGLVGNQVVLTGLHNHVTRKVGVQHAIYRTIMVAGLQSQAHYKVTGSLQGGAFLGPVVVNDDTADTWTFTDSMSDAVAANNEQLYTDTGALDRTPAPPFSCGVAAFDRMFVRSSTNTIWFSGEKTDGDAYWWNPFQQIPVPTKEEVKAIRVLDDFLLVMCAGSKMFAIPNGPWPDARGVGSIPAARELPFSNGCTGQAISMSDGVMYGAVQGGIWIVTRDMRNIYLGAPVEDEKAAAESFVGCAADDRQRVAFLTNGAKFLVYDQVTGVWAVWSSDPQGGSPVVLADHKGRFTYLSSLSTAPSGDNVHRQALGQFFDGRAGAPTPISTIVELAPIHLGGVRRVKRLWQAQMLGEWRGDHDLRVQVAIDDQPAIVGTHNFTPGSTAPYIYELPANAATELASAWAYTIQDLFPRGWSAGFALEMLSMWVGAETKLGGVPASRRVGTL